MTYVFRSDHARMSWDKILRLVDDNEGTSALTDQETRALLLTALAVVREARDKRGGRALQMLCEVYDDAYYVVSSDQEVLMVNEEAGMEKYGVAVVPEDPGTTKTAASGVPCPLCGEQTEMHGNVRMCPKHGSKPFEAARG